jgi:hypothetical protein
MGYACLAALGAMRVAAGSGAGGSIRLREHAIDVIDNLEEARVLAVARTRNGDPEIGADAAGVLAQHHDAVGQRDGLFDVVSDDEDRARGHLLAFPQLQQFGAQVLGGEHVERGERLVHEEHFGLHHQRAGETDALLHAAGKLLREGGFETVEAHRVDGPEAALHALVRRRSDGFERRLDVIEHRQPGKQREALKHDGDVGARAGQRFAVP